MHLGVYLLVHSYQLKIPHVGCRHEALAGWDCVDEVLDW